ncbi:hypothetical protein LNO89_27265 [Klebsiella pneumoniae subsp. pneumoniae]|nr:hypothetical protein [Klebsiella pneumoniae subsp. pneumoniae]
MAPPPSGAGALHVGIPVNIQALLSEKVSQALIAAGAPADCEPQVRQSAKVQFGDYQANGVMAVAKKLGSGAATTCRAGTVSS